MLHTFRAVLRSLLREEIHVKFSRENIVTSCFLHYLSLERRANIYLNRRKGVVGLLNSKDKMINLIIMVVPLAYPACQI
jgi:hypothetical protein